MASEAARVEIGTVVKGRFVLEEEIGRGGMGQVFKARDKNRDEAGSRTPYVALKVMSVDGVDFHSAFVAMQREAQRCQLLNHRGVVRVHDFDRDGALVYTTMELLSGNPLSKLIQDARQVGIPDATAAAYVIAIAEALAHAHEQGIVHSDLKPSNVFITDSGDVKVIDFGIARAMPKRAGAEEIRTVFDPRAQLGAATPAYASAELLAGEDPDPRDDLYSLGCIAYELYAGKHPFGGIDAISARTNELVPRRPEGLAQTRWAAIVGALAFDRERRTANVETFLQEFNRRSRDSIEVGDVIKDRFVLVEAIGGGGMSRVFKALDRVRQGAGSRTPYVALKIMLIPGIDFHAGFVAMQREAQRSQLLNHSGIVRIHDCDLDGEIAFLTMELLDGKSLHDLITATKGSGIPAEQAVAYVNRIGEALAHAHDHGIVHADLKPGNVFVTRQGEVKVIDFGIARALPRPGSDGPTVFDAREQLGAISLSYASLEMIEGAKADYSDDVYSLACTAYETFAGTVPFPSALHARAKNLEPRKPPGVNAGQWRAIKNGLALERAHRTQDIHTFLEEFNGGGKAPSKVAAPGPNDETQVYLAPKPRHRVVKASATGATLAVALGALVLFLRVPEPAPSQTDTFRDCAQCPLLGIVAPGTFTMGRPESDRALLGETGFFEYPERSIQIPAPFSMGLREVSVGEFREFAESAGGDFTGCRAIDTNWVPDPALSFNQPGFDQTDTHPVTCVSWGDAQRYVQWLSTKTGHTYRLPSEAEWEYVARVQAGADAGSSRAPRCEEANVADEATVKKYPGIAALSCSDAYPYTAPVDRAASEAKFVDLVGNVFEWTDDCWASSYIGVPEDGSRRAEGSCGERVLRGGSWLSDPTQLRLTFRNRFDQDYRSNTFGFRVVRELEESNESS